ncbi:rod shape-determining protein RodA [Abyssalbus ytuae]|uniref:Rod shape-determining protein RodA n=1 Tax=Abyssalbus ytuae TaxID=2926907 RepID=A0A9E7D2Z6_9FLAO|nr:rod shape-determining protein RodA [Abyssalbus ytuae]UOB18713.1 rod shape-determining protein RodA [Abyssalbus ytuae]
MSSPKLIHNIDWITVLLYLILVFIGWLNIYSTTITEEAGSIFNLNLPYGKQLLFIGLSSVLIIIVISLEAKFYERFSSIIYLIFLVLLAGLFIFGKNINGATSWYNFGGFSFQPSEFAKIATALAVSKHLSDFQTNISDIKHQLQTLLIIGIPAVLIIAQPDPGSALVFSAFFFVMYREGLSMAYLIIGTLIIALFITTLMFGVKWVVIGMGILLSLLYFFRRKSKKKFSFLLFIGIITLTFLFSLSVKYIFDNVFEQRHRDRFSLWLRLEKDPEKLEEIRKTIGYNTHQSETTIGSGGLTGKGFLEGTRTKGNFVPEQHSDYIFTTVGEEWGFVGTTSIVILFTLLLLRLIILAERQKSKFSRIYGYGVASILFFHFAINIGMVIGLLPTIGIPLPLFSYGGSGLWGFTILIFIFLKLDANRVNEWL